MLIKILSIDDSIKLSTLIWNGFFDHEYEDNQSKFENPPRNNQKCYKSNKKTIKCHWNLQKYISLNLDTNFLGYH